MATRPPPGGRARSDSSPLVQQAFDEQRPGDGLKATSRGYRAAPSDALKEAVKFVAATKEKPTHVVIYFGLNDSRNGNGAKTLENSAANLRAAVEGFKAAGAESITCTPTVWRAMKQAAPHAEVARETAAEPKAPVLDLWAAFDRDLRGPRAAPKEGRGVCGLGFGKVEGKAGEAVTLEAGPRGQVNKVKPPPREWEYAKVEFRDGDKLLGVAEKAPWRLEGVKLEPGLHALIPVGVKADGTRVCGLPALSGVR